MKNLVALLSCLALILAAAEIASAQYQPPVYANPMPGGGYMMTQP